LKNRNILNPSIVKKIQNEKSFMIKSLVENIQREDLTSMETAKFIKRTSFYLCFVIIY